MSVILATAGSNSSTSINFSLVQYTVGKISGHPVETVELAGIDFPMYSEDLEKAAGIPDSITRFKAQIQDSRGLLLSVNEHNGNPSAFFKNILDWLSRDERRFLDGKPVMLMSASGGKGGASSSRAIAENMLKRFGAEIVSTFSLHTYYESFDPEKGITDAGQASMHKAALTEFLTHLSAESQ